MNTKFLYFLPIILTSCSNDLKQDSGKINHDSIVGHWRCETTYGYTELQVSDSLYYYIDDGEYIGPVVPIPYKIENDSLFWLEERGDKRRGFKIIGCDSELLILKNKFDGKERWKKFVPKLEIKYWTMQNDSMYDSEFLKRKNG